MENVNPEFARSDSKNQCRRTVNVFPPCLRLALGRWPFRSDHTDPSVQFRNANTDPSMQFRWGHTEFLFCKMLGKNLDESVRPLSHLQTSPGKSSCQDAFGKSLCNALPYCHPSGLPSGLLGSHFYTLA